MIAKTAFAEMGKNNDGKVIKKDLFGSCLEQEEISKMWLQGLQRQSMSLIVAPPSVQWPEDKELPDKLNCSEEQATDVVDNDALVSEL